MLSISCNFLAPDCWKLRYPSAVLFAITIEFVPLIVRTLTGTEDECIEDEDGGDENLYVFHVKVGTGGAMYKVQVYMRRSQIVDRQ